MLVPDKYLPESVTCRGEDPLKRLTGVFNKAYGLMISGTLKLGVGPCGV